ncbi:MAG: putative selenium-dependent hydroxylase accessory protein YqeC [Christensenellaceae bacterium]|jgi:probable selenium-dependent hydroxylase accessory protein YqeC|nr:putative selenium-dependent hydroxylase accessory protein YqeC [Christensenellaceae bacterium]
MELSQALRIERGVTSIIGGGGKSTLLLLLGKELAANGAKTVLCTTAHMYPPQGVPLVTGGEEDILRQLGQSELVCAGAPAEEGKLQQSQIGVNRLAALAEYVLIEADGSRGLPLKAHAAYEPNVPRETVRLVYVVGMQGIGKPISACAHRPALYAALLGREETHIVTPADAMAAMAAEGFGHAVALLNQAEGARLQFARQAAAGYAGRAVISSLQGKSPVLEIWEGGMSILC